MRTLIVEDEIDIQKLVKIILSPFSQCDTANDGGEAVLKFLTAINQEQYFDLIILDIMMPIMNGINALEKMRIIEREMGIKEVDGVKVIMLTASDDTANVIGSFRHQCDAYLTKPFCQNELISEIKRLNLIS